MYMRDISKVNEFTICYTGSNIPPFETISKMFEEELSKMCPYFGVHELSDVAKVFSEAWLANSEAYNKLTISKILINAFAESLDGRTLNMILSEIPKLVDLYRCLEQA